MSRDVSFHQSNDKDLYVSYIIKNNQMLNCNVELTLCKADHFKYMEA